MLRQWTMAMRKKVDHVIDCERSKILEAITNKEASDRRKKLERKKMAHVEEIYITSMYELKYIKY